MRKIGIPLQTPVFLYKSGTQGDILLMDVFLRIAWDVKQQHKLVQNSPYCLNVFDVIMSLIYGIHVLVLYLGLCVRKPTIWVPTRSNTKRAVQSQMMVRGWKFWI